MLKKIIFATIITAILAAAGIAVGDTDNAPGSMCVAAGGNLTINTAGHSYNDTTSALTAVCPSERLIIDGSFATKFKSTVWVLDRHADQNVCCRAVSRNPAGTTIQSDEVCSAGSSSSYQQLETAEITDNYSFSHFFLKCTVPPKSGSSASTILTYRSVQN